MRERRYAPLGATTALDTRVTAIEAGGVYLPLTAGSSDPLTGALWVEAGGGESMVIKDDVAGGNSYNAWIQWKDSSNVDQGYVGFGSAGNETFYINNQSGGDILLNTSGDVDISCGSTGALEITGSSYKLNPTGIRIGQYTATQGYIQAPAGGQVEIWTDGTGAIAKFQDDLSTRLGGDLYIDGSTAGHFEDVTGQFGSVQVSGETTWDGYSIGGRFVLMGHTSEQRFGLYDDVDNRWAIQWNPNNDTSNEECWLYSGTAFAAKTKPYTATAQTSSLNIRNHAGTELPAGFNTMPRVVTNASVTLAAEHCGGYVYSNDASTYTVTVTNGTDLPADAVITIINFGSGNINVNQSSTTLYHLDGSLTSGNRVVGPYSVATLVRYGTTAWFLWGSSIT